MQHPTTHHPIIADNLPWQEQLLIRLDEIVGLLDSIESRLAQWEERGTGIRCRVSECQGDPTPDTAHLDTANLCSVVCPLSSDTQPLSPNAEEQPQ